MKVLRYILVLLVTFIGIFVFSDGSRSKPENEPFTFSYNTFAIKFYQSLAVDSVNIFCSPYSLYNALTMVAAGARTSTASEFGDVLCFPSTLKTNQVETPWDMSPIHSSLASINSRLEYSNESEIRDKIEELEKAYMDSCVVWLDGRSEKDSAEVVWQLLIREDKAYERLYEAKEELPKYELRLANSLWYQNSYVILEEYVHLIERYYASNGIFKADFINESLKSKRQIEAWISSKTHGRINVNLSFSEWTRLILVNTIYFEGSWKQPFEYKDTKPREFILSSQDTVKTAMMSSDRYGDAKYAAFNADGSWFSTPMKIFPDQEEGLYPGPDGFSILELPYKESDLAMVIIAPNSPDGLPDIEKRLTSNELDSWIAELRSRKVKVSIPKYEMEVACELFQSLNSLGLSLAFDRKKADFSGMFSLPANVRAYIYTVLQNSRIKVNEKGTEATVATMVRIDVTSSQGRDKMIHFIPIFKADRPFLFMIRDTKSGIIIFIGKIVCPQELSIN